MDLRKIDRLVAEKVLGWTIDGKDSYDETGYRCPLPFFSEEIAAAWEVVEHFSATNHVSLHTCIETPTGPLRWEFNIDRVLMDPDAPLAETAPLAICLAALRARGVEV